MSSTRYAKPGSPVSDERYMSSPELVQLRGISGSAVAARCKVLTSPIQREFLFFLQAMSIREGGLMRLASDLIQMFPKRIGTPTMHRLGMEGQIQYSGESLFCIDREIAAGFDGDEKYERLAELLDMEGVIRNDPRRVTWQEALARCQKAAIDVIPEFIVELCVNPRMEFQAPGDNSGRSVKVEAKLRREKLGDCSTIKAEILQFQDIIGALFEYKRLHENTARAGFCHTVISRKIWAELDAALQTRTMCLVNGLPGRGKTEAVRAWCECHLGVARFASLDGTSTKTAQFRELARVLGVGHGSSRKAQEMQCAVKEILQGSGIMPVIDEAHFFFEQGARIRSRPEMLDWIDTALCNPPIPVALITTPQFMTCLERAAVQAEWNYLQFQRRCKRTVELPSKNTTQDVKAVTKHLLPNADANTINLILGYEKLSGRDMSAVGDAVREARRIAEESGEHQVSFEHVDRAVNELTASDQPWALLRRRVAEGLTRKRAGRRLAAALDILPGEEKARPGSQGSVNADDDAPKSKPEPSRMENTFGRRTAPEHTRETRPVELNTTLA